MRRDRRRLRRQRRRGLRARGDDLRRRACASAGTTSCLNGHVVDSCVPSPPAASDETCDGIDDDCDGAADEHFCTSSTTCGVGACHAIGATSCLGGQIFDSCTPGQPLGADTNCDGIDDNCNGAVDENYAPISTTWASASAW